MRFGSVCSGIEAASVAWAPLGFEPAWFSEVAKFPNAVLAHRHPGVPNHGSLIGLADRLIGDARRIDLLVGGTPCQPHSVAGLRGGVADERDLTTPYARLAKALRPRWLLWENVPGVLSSDGGRAFGALLGALARIGYGLAWRVLDAQFCRVDGYGRAVPQRRERVFLVGHLGAAASAGAVLFEPEGVRGNPPTRRAAREDVAGTPGGGSAGRGWCSDTDRTTFVPEVAATYIANAEGAQEPLSVTRSSLAKTVNNQTPLVCFDETQVTSAAIRSTGRGDTAALAKSARPPAIAFHQTQDPITGDEFSPALGTTSSGMGDAHALRGEGFDASEDGTGRGTPLVPVNWRVRRLTPRECERLQGFPDDYTLVPGSSDSSRYAALGNSMAVNVMRWIGQRIQMVDRVSA